LPRHTFDAEYVRRLAEGDEGTEAHFTGYFTHLLRAKLRSRLRKPHLVDDVFQETFFRVLKSIREKGGLRDAGALGAYVNSVCNHILLEVYRAEARTTPDVEERPSREVNAEDALVSREQLGEVREVLSALPQKDQTILRWLFFDGVDKDEVCRRLSVEREYLRVLVHRAKLRFRSDFLGRQRAPAPAIDQTLSREAKQRGDA
jgi:RNA polymerase sigma-70 factor (ECF subfamily)